jgi:YVTN family beta-propeller protein
MRRIIIIPGILALTTLGLTIRAGAFQSPAEGGVLLVTNKSANTLSIIDPATGEELANLPTGSSPHEVAATPNGKLAFIADYGGNTLTVVDVAGRKVSGTVDLGEHRRPHGIVVSSDGSSVWVTTEGSQDLVEVDVATRSVKRAISTGQRTTHMVALVENRNKAYTANIGSGNVTVIDTKAGLVLAHIPTGAGAEGIAATPDGRYVLVTNREAGTITAIDAASDEIVHSADVGGFPIRVEVTPDGKRALVSQAEAETLLEIELDGFQVSRRLSIGRFPVGIEIRPDGAVAYVANTRDNVLTIVDLTTFEAAGTLEAGDEPDGMAWAGL